MPGFTLADKIQLLRLDRTSAGQRPPSDADVATAIASAASARRVDENTLYRLRTGRTDNPRMMTLVALAEYFEVSPDYFFPGPALEPAEQRQLTAALARSEVRKVLRRLAVMDDEKVAALDRLLGAS